MSLLFPRAATLRWHEGFGASSITASECRRRAEECRSLAETCLTDEAADILKDLASDLDETATALDSRIRTPIGSGRY